MVIRRNQHEGRFMTTVLKVQGLSLSFGKKPVLNQLSFEIPQGSVLAVIGPNGAGKTVLFKTLVGMLAHSGTVEWLAGTRLGYVPQKLDVERDLPLTGLDLLHAKAAVVGIPSAPISRVLTDVDLDPEVARQPIGVLSGGQFQRLLLAVALLGDPDVLLLDEVTAGVDEVGQAHTYQLLDRLAAERKRTVLLISHDLSVVYQRATHVLCLGQARAWFGPPDQVLTPKTLALLYGPAAHRLHLHDLHPAQ